MAAPCGAGKRVAALALCALLAVACGSEQTSGESADVVAIGAALNPQEGAGVESMYRGIELAVEHLNAERGGTGRPFVIRRTPQDITGSVQIASMLRDDPRVVGVVGHQGSAPTLDAKAIYEDRERNGERALVAVSPAATSPALSGASPWLFRVCPSDLDVSRVAARYVLDSLRATRAVVVYRSDPFGKDWTRSFAEHYARGGGQILARNPYLAGVVEWEAYAEQLRRIRPDVVLFPGSGTDAADAIRAFRRAGADVPLIGSDNVSVLERAGGEFAGVRYTAFFVPSRPPATEGRAFVSAFERRFHEPPDQQAALAYDAALVIGRAVLAVGADRNRVRDWIEQVGRKGPPIRGATGTIAFDERHDVVQKNVVITAIGGARP
ncbi:MAG: ABC transporter substrate-binding protein [Gemmatimonadaceae bacterium]